VRATLDVRNPSNNELIVKEDANSPYGDKQLEAAEPSTSDRAPRKSSAAVARAQTSSTPSTG